MKVKRVVQMVSATTDTGRLACDMYDLDEKEYYSQARKEYIPIADMDFQHMVRAFVKQNDEDIRNDTQEGKIVDVIKAKDSIINGLRSQVETLSDKVKDQDRGRVLRIKELKEQLEEKDQQWSTYTSMLARQRDMYKSIAKERTRLNGHYYTFSEVPQDEEGKEFIKNCKKYLNKESYAIRVRGQHLKKELYGQGRASWGANMEDSSHMRVYIDKKKGDE
mgnify:CR=1 FL=1